MLESNYRNRYDESYQKGFEIGVSKASLDGLIMMVGNIKATMSEEKWERYKKSAEKKHRKYITEYPETTEKNSGYYDEKGQIIKEKWIETQIDIMECLGFAEGSWEDICAFVERYPELPAASLARRIIRESEYKYI